jgi:hypothetical protein
MPFTPLFQLEGCLPVPGDPWESLPKAELVASSEDTLRLVLSRAAEQLGLHLADDALQAMRSTAERDGRLAPSDDPADHLVWAAFRRPDDDEIIDASLDPPVRRRDARLYDVTKLAVRDEHGRAIWRDPPFDATVAELLDAAEAGLIDGDPLKPYLIPSVPQGDAGGLEVWQAIIIALGTARGVLGVAADIDGVLGLRDRLAELWRRRERAGDVVERHASSWHDRGAAPHDLVRLLRTRAWTSAEAAALLGCSPEEADAVLWGLGFVSDPATSTWTYRTDPAAELIAGDLDLYGIDELAGDGEDLYRSLLEQRLDEFLRTGEIADAYETRLMIMREHAAAIARDLDLGSEPRSTLRDRLRLRRRS